MTSSDKRTVHPTYPSQNHLGRKVGVLGGGQLARMLILEGHKLGLEMHVLSASPDDPAAQVTSHWHKGDVGNVAHVQAFFKNVDVATFESEFLSEKTLSQAQSASQIEIQPNIKLIDKLSDRLEQKIWLEKHGIATAAFAAVSQKSDVYAFLRAQKGQSLVFKKRRFGYDGFGTFIIKERRQLETWLDENQLPLKEFIVEQYVPFKRELAVQIAINARKEIHLFPLVQWKAENSKCLWVKGPATASGLTRILRKMVKGLKDSNYVGLAAFELFETSGGLLVNEMAPRVHNSGHYSLEGLALNQFSAHLHAILNLPLSPKAKLVSPGFAMLNLIGQSTNSPVLIAPDKVSLHWYGKKENRAGRKMGHVTALGSTPEKALREVLKVGKEFKL